MVVELFTSQGCSSCPPANAFLNELSKQPSDVLALAFHVTYWDYLGWKDPFSLAVATVGQAQYGHRFGVGSYTPEMVVDGAAGLVGSYRDEINSAIAKARAKNVTAAEVNLVMKDGKASIDIGAGRGVARVMLVGFDREHVTAIGRGEEIAPAATMARKPTSSARFAPWGNGTARRFISRSSFPKASRSR